MLDLKVPQVDFDSGFGFDFVQGFGEVVVILELDLVQE